MLILKEPQRECQLSDDAHVICWQYGSYRQGRHMLVRGSYKMLFDSRMSCLREFSRASRVFGREVVLHKLESSREPCDSFYSLCAIVSDTLKPEDRFDVMRSYSETQCSGWFGFRLLRMLTCEPRGRQARNPSVHANHVSNGFLRLYCLPQIIRQHTWKYTSYTIFANVGGTN